MGEYHLLRLWPARPAQRPKRKPGGAQGNLKLPNRKRQEERIGPTFQRLAKVFDGSRDPQTLRDDPAGLAPERVLVFEVAGSVPSFLNAVNRVPGLEYLSEYEDEFEPTEDFWVKDTREKRKGKRRDDKPVGSSVYMAMPDLQALQELLSLWNRFQAGKPFPYGFTPWRDVFKQLKQLRTWGPKDRVPGDVIDGLHDAVKMAPGDRVAVEIELWARRSESARHRADASVSQAVDDSGGSVLDRCSIPEIAYQGMLAKLPRGEVDRIARHDEIQLTRCDEVMFVRPQSRPSLWPVCDQSTLDSELVTETREVPTKPPVAALIDGLPIQRHRLLDGRIIVDDPDAVEEQSTIDRRRHGTAMASLIVHGDLNDDQVPLSRLLHVHPVLLDHDNDTTGFDPNRLVIDTFYSVIRTIKEGTKDADPTAPRVFLINVSLGDFLRPYANQISPWARLLDYLAYRYQILFLVSAGNVPYSLTLPEYSGYTSFEESSPEQLQESVLRALGEVRQERTLLSPSEAINVVTVGAAHSPYQESENELCSSRYPYQYKSFPNVSSALGLGHLRTIKPDILMPGGREPVRMASTHPISIEPLSEGLYPSCLKVASPDPKGNLDKMGPSSGTSSATALATRLAHRLFDILSDPDHGGVLVEAKSHYFALVVRSLLIHSCHRNREVVTKLEAIYGPHGRGQHRARAENVARVLGFGIPDFEQASACATNRATLIGYGDINGGETVSHDIPLPASLSGQAVPKSITVTLAWFSPVNARNSRYRMVKLIVEGQKSQELGTEKRSSSMSEFHAVRRGTVIHERYEGKRARLLSDGERISLLISSSSEQGFSDEPIPYGLTVTIATSADIPVYEEIREALRVQVRD